MEKEIGLYIHIPFCKSKCFYCDFVSFAGKNELINRYIDALIKELQIKEINNYNISTIYIGGGTPSILDSSNITRILNEIKPYTKQNTEITIEINPGTVNKEKLIEYKKEGINRLSIGLQSTNNKLLKQIGRIHKYEDFLEVYNMARNIGFVNINIDLMLGLPNQSLKDLEESVKKIIELNPEHISIYSLILEEGTKLFDMVNNKEVKLPDENLERKMYWKVKKMLEENGYNHYEISNFAKKERESMHNTDCWNQKEYIGVGVAAHSYLNEVRFSNTENLEEYIKNINNDNFEQNIIVHERQCEEEKQKEYMLLGLRKIKGVCIKEFKNKFAENPITLYKKELEKLINEELIEIDGDNIKLTNKGLDLANLVWEEFV